eukprot:2464784-Prymnesium_polylepis.1
MDSDQRHTRCTPQHYQVRYINAARRAWPRYDGTFDRGAQEHTSARKTPHLIARHGSNQPKRPKQ